MIEISGAVSVSYNTVSRTESKVGFVGASSPPIISIGMGSQQL